jgi:hypothetical protein
MAEARRGRTLMRPLLVKRQTSPESGSFRFFPQCEASAASSRCRVLTSFPCAGANQTWLHQTRIEVQSPLAGRLQSTVGVILCDLEIMLCPHTVPLKRPAERVGLASECQARGRGSTRKPCASKRHIYRSQSGRPIKRKGSGIRVLCTPGRSKTQPSRIYSVRDSGSSRACPVRPPAHPLCSFRYVGRYLYRKPFCA